MVKKTIKPFKKSSVKKLSTLQKALIASFILGSSALLFKKLLHQYKLNNLNLKNSTNNSIEQKRLLLEKKQIQDKIIELHQSQLKNNQKISNDVLHLVRNKIALKSKEQHELKLSLEYNIRLLYSELIKAKVVISGLTKNDACNTYHRFLKHIDNGCKYSQNLHTCRKNHLIDYNIDIDFIESLIKKIAC